MEALKTIVAIATESFLSFLAVTLTFATVCLVVFGIARILRDMQVFLLEKQQLEAEIDLRSKEESGWEEEKE